MTEKKARRFTPVLTIANQSGGASMLLFAIVVLMFLIPPSAAAESQPPWITDLFSGWNGHIKILSRTTWQASDSLFSPDDSGRYDDGQMYFRLKKQSFLSDEISFDIHYEAVFFGGDTHKALSRLGSLPGIFSAGATALDDRRRPFDLTHTVHSDPSASMYHRLDRLSISFFRNWGSLHMGRQALTWGNGLIFNPMDLFNPFAPTDVDRDYKIGDDMALLQVDRLLGADVQIVYVPRREPVSGDLQWAQSSLAGKMQWILPENEIQILVSRHMQDLVAGIGVTGYLGDALWRSDLTWTHIEGKEDRANDYLTWVANIDYSWLWLGKNIYGILELYYNGLGESDPWAALIKPALTKRLARGELFTTGRWYTGATLEVEAHPLVKMTTSLIWNLADGSAVLLPRVLWDVRQNLQITVSANLYLGETGSEFGGFHIPGTPLAYRPADAITVWATFFF